MKKLWATAIVTGMMLALTACGVIPTPTPPAPPNGDLPAVAVGDTVPFGTWRGEPIQWRVLAIEPGKALIIADSPVAIRQYNDQDKAVTWETSALRKWLAEEFYPAAFSVLEQQAIQTTTVKTPGNKTYGTPGGADTQDKVFLLSADEAATLFADDAARIASYTMTETDVEYLLGIAKTSWKYDADRLAQYEELLRGVSLGHSDQISWWLRSPERAKNVAAAVTRDGTPGGWEVYLDGAVRPAMWVNAAVDPSGTPS